MMRHTENQQDTIAAIEEARRQGMRFVILGTTRSTQNQDDMFDARQREDRGGMTDAQMSFDFGDAGEVKMSEPESAAAKPNEGHGIVDDWVFAPVEENCSSVRRWGRIAGIAAPVGAFIGTMMACAVVGYALHYKHKIEIAPELENPATTRAVCKSLALPIINTFSDAVREELNCDRFKIGVPSTPEKGKSNVR